MRAICRCRDACGIIFGALLCFASNPVQGQQKPVKLPGGMAPLHQITKVGPRYPVEARRAQVSGMVYLRVLIGIDGKVQNVKALSGHPMLVEAAAEAVKTWVYEPYVMNGQSRSVQTVLEVDFSFSPPKIASDNVPIPPGLMASGLLAGIDPSLEAHTKKGVAALRITVNTSGEVIDATVLEGPSELTDMARRAVLGWKFTPFMHNGAPIGVTSIAAFDFE